MIKNEAIKVQPMSAPSGKLFYFDFKYDEKKRSRKFVICYINNNGVQKKRSVKASSLELAIKKIRDFESLQYHFEE